MRPAHAGAVITPALRLGLGVLLFLCLVGAANMLAAWLASSLRIDLNPRTEPFIHDLITWSLIGYGVLIALPFVPGIEIAVALVMVAGPGIAPVLYAATIAGLCLSFAAGRLVPLSALVWILDRVRLRRLGQLAAEMKQRDQPGRLDLLASSSGWKVVPRLLRYRYLTLAILLNMPGNIVLGGAGGIMFFAGLSRLFSPVWFVATICIAALPLPIAVVLFGDSLLVLE